MKHSDMDALERSAEVSPYVDAAVCLRCSLGVVIAVSQIQYPEFKPRTGGDCLFAVMCRSVQKAMEIY